MKAKQDDGPTCSLRHAAEAIDAVALCQHAKGAGWHAEFLSSVYCTLRRRVAHGRAFVHSVAPYIWALVNVNCAL